jgi:hypothetical protein
VYFEIGPRGDLVFPADSMEEKDPFPVPILGNTDNEPNNIGTGTVELAGIINCRQSQQVPYAIQNLLNPTS